MGRRPFGKPFNFSYFPVESASIPFASLFMVFPMLFPRQVFATKMPGGNLEYSNHVPCPISCCKNQNVHFLRFLKKNPLQGKCALVNHPINNHLRIRWSVIFGASTLSCVGWRHQGWLICPQPKTRILRNEKTIKRKMILRKPLARCKSMLPTIIGLVLGLGTDLKNNQPVNRKKGCLSKFLFWPIYRKVHQNEFIWNCNMQI